jgi:hypothetical protein
LDDFAEGLNTNRQLAPRQRGKGGVQGDHRHILGGPVSALFVLARSTSKQK